MELTGQFRFTGKYPLEAAKMAKSDRRADIMGAAERLFTSRRYHEISLDDIAQAAKVGKGTIYRYFKNKEDLFVQTAQGGYDELCEVIRREVPGDASFSKQLLSACRQISSFFARRRQLFRMMQTEQARMFWRRGEVRGRWRERRRKLVQAVADIIAKGVTEDRVRKDVSVEVLAGHLLGMLRTRAWTAKETSATPEPLETAIELFCNGALERPTPTVEATASRERRIAGGGS